MQVATFRIWCQTLLEPSLTHQMPRTAAITVRIDPVLKAQIDKLAQNDGRSASQYVERLLIAHLSKSGAQSSLVETNLAKKKVRSP